jgi:hypothetical protein
MNWLFSIKGYDQQQSLKHLDLIQGSSCWPSLKLKAGTIYDIKILG